MCHEFSALALSNMATEFSSKASIFEHQGIEPLVRCLSSNDPDVQKNAIEALALLLMVRSDEYHLITQIVFNPLYTNQVSYFSSFCRISGFHNLNFT